MAEAAGAEELEAAWLEQVWGAGRVSLLDNPAQNVDFGPTQLQVWAARIADTAGLCVAPTASEEQPAKVDGTAVVVLTSGEKAKAFHEQSHEDAHIDFDATINGFYVCLNPATKWVVSWPAQNNHQGSGASKTRSSVADEVNSFQNHESYEISVKVPKADEAYHFSDCATVALGYQVIITVLFETSDVMDLTDEDSDALPKRDSDGKYIIKEVRVDCNFLNQSGLVVMKVCAAPPPSAAPASSSVMF